MNFEFALSFCSATAESNKTTQLPSNELPSNAPFSDIPSLLRFCFLGSDYIRMKPTDYTCLKGVTEEPR